MGDLSVPAGIRDETEMAQMIVSYSGAGLVLLVFLVSESARPQVAIPTSPPPPTTGVEIVQDPLGRTTPRGTVRGFLTSAATGDEETASQYLNTRKKGPAAILLAHQLFVVLNRRVRVQLNEISDQPDGSLSSLAEPDKQLIDTVSSDAGDIDLVLERVGRKNGGSIWLFSGKTLAAVPDLYQEVSTKTSENALVKFLLGTRIAHIALINWLGVFIGLPLLHLVAVGLNRFLSGVAGRLRRTFHKNSDLPNPEVLPSPVRLLLLACSIPWIMSRISLPLLARQFWTGVAVVILVAGCVWLTVSLSSWLESKIRLRLWRHNSTGALSILRLARSAFDSLVIFVGLLVLLQYFGIRATTALAGLGVGGIAVALAAQKTLENIIAGIALVSDKALRVGDFLRVGNTLGTVTDIGLRSTRIRTLDRTVVNVPNGQVANATVENLSLRDKFWFHHFLALICETSAAQVRQVLEGLTDVVAQRPEVDHSTGHVRLLRFGTSSFDAEVFAYVAARDWTDFLRIQEQLLLDMIQTVERAGARIAVPSQIMYLNSYLTREIGTDPGMKDSPSNKMEWTSQRLE